MSSSSDYSVLCLRKTFIDDVLQYKGSVKSLIVLDSTFNYKIFAENFIK